VRVGLPPPDLKSDDTAEERLSLITYIGSAVGGVGTMLVAYMVLSKVKEIKKAAESQTGITKSQTSEGYLPAVDADVEAVGGQLAITSTTAEGSSGHDSGKYHSSKSSNQMHSAKVVPLYN